MIWAAVIILVAALAYALSAQPKTQTPQPQRGTVPAIKDGKRVIRVYGTVWIDDPMQIAMLQVGEDPIKKKGGK